MTKAVQTLGYGAHNLQCSCGAVSHSVVAPEVLPAECQAGLAWGMWVAPEIKQKTSGLSGSAFPNC